MLKAVQVMDKFFGLLMEGRIYLLPSQSSDIIRRLLNFVEGALSGEVSELTANFCQWDEIYLF